MEVGGELPAEKDFRGKGSGILKLILRVSPEAYKNLNCKRENKTKTNVEGVS